VFVGIHVPGENSHSSHGSHNGGMSSSHVYTNSVTTNLRFFFLKILFVYFPTRYNFLIEIKLWKKNAYVTF
jgi:hypothetical protein